MKYILILPFIGLLWLPFYNFESPAWLGVPFFYWYQFIWIPVTSLLVWMIYKRQHVQEDD